ncbi:MAG: hypothetical protein LBS72_10390, partial [Oscillospiraceae bacterium]|nr:hypothetical protein [Oscillospiraceae bacterium]
MAEPNIVYNQTDLRDALTAVNNNKEGEIILGSNIALDTPWVTIEKLEGTESNDIIINGNGYQIGDAEHPLTSALIGEGLHVTVNNVKIYCVREEIVESANEVLVGSFFNRVQFAELEGCVASGLITITINNPASYGGFFGGLIGLARQGNDAKAGTISLSNCINNIDIVVYKDENGSSNGSIGGIIGYAAGEKVTITDCYNHGKIEANLRCIGGIIGKSVGQTTIINECVNCAEIKAETEKYEMFVGGILGYINGNGYTSQPLVEHCDNKGDILVKGIKKQFVGGIAGEGVRITITECSSSVGVTILATSYSGSVTADEWFVGGIVGRVWTYVSSKVNKCTNYSNVISTEHGYVAGIAGYVYNYSASSVEDVYELSNYGDIEGTFYAAGICGRSDASIINSNNYGNIISDNGAAAGITCEISADRKIGSCDNYGKVRGFSFASGIVREGHVIESCVNRGEINANGAGGLAAGIACVLTIASNPPGTMTNCHNKGDIISLNIASGI